MIPLDKQRSLWWHVAVREFKAISSDYSILLVLLGGIFAYGFLYNYMYAPNVVHDVPIVVVDHSHSSMSRQYMSWMDATPQVQVEYVVADMAEAKRLMLSAQVFGILYLPENFETLVFEGQQSVFPFYASTDAFLYYEAMAKANLQVMEAMDGVYRQQLIGNLPLSGLAAVATQAPVEVVGYALYNPLEGYGIYLIPSVLMLILFQTLMMLVAMRAGTEKKSPPVVLYTKDTLSSCGMAFQIVVGKSLVYCLLYGIFSLFMFGILPLFFDIPRMASWGELFCLLTPYLLGTSFLGLFLSRWYADPEAPILLIAFFSIGLLFLAGVSYPLELMPWYWQIAHYIVPATSGTLAFVMLNCMDAPLNAVSTELLVLWIQVVVYFILAVDTYRRKLDGRFPPKLYSAVQ